MTKKIFSSLVIREKCYEISDIFLICRKNKQKFVNNGERCSFVKNKAKTTLHCEKNSLIYEYNKCIRSMQH